MMMMAFRMSHQPRRRKSRRTKRREIKVRTLLRRHRGLQRQRKQARQRQVWVWKPFHGLHPKFNGSKTALGPAAAPAAAGAGPRFTYQSLSKATNNFEKRLGGGGCGVTSRGITLTHLKTEHVMGTQVYMAPEYHRVGELSTKVDAFAFELVIIETLTGYAVCSPATGHHDLLSMFGEDLDNPTKLLAHLDKRACWDQHKQERIGRLYAIADKCLELHRKKRPELVELIPELEEVRRGTEALQALEAERVVRPLVEAEAAEKECCICLKAEEVGRLLALVPCGHRCVCADCSTLVLGHFCPICRTEARQVICVFD
jgi:hypothetical protein